MSKTILDIDIIDTHNNLTIGIADASTYDPNIPIANPSIEITPPGGFSKVTLPFSPKSINTINSNLVGITISCDYNSLRELPDGIWTFRYSIKPNLTSYVDRYYMRTAIIECKLQGLLLKNLMNDKLDSTKRDQNLKSILDAEILIEGSISAANRADIQTSLELYRKADKLLDIISDKNCNNC